MSECGRSFPDSVEQVAARILGDEYVIERTNRSYSGGSSSNFHDPDRVEPGLQTGHEIAGCAVLVGSPMPDWTIEQIRSVHVRMHKAEGVLFPEALSRAGEGCDLNLVAVSE